MDDATLHVLNKKMKLNPGKSLIEFKIGGRVCINLLLSWPNKLTSISKLRIPVVNKQSIKIDKS